MEPSPPLPPPEQPPPLPDSAARKIQAAVGFGIGAVIWLLPFTAYDGIGFLLIACFVLSPISAILAVIPQTRFFGLGLLLACGLGWSVLGLMCSGIF